MNFAAPSSNSQPAYPWYQAVANGVALSDQSGRVRLEVTGPDRAKFLHNLTTNEVKRLPVGQGCEAFVTSTQGKTLAFVKILNSTDSILVSADPGGMVLAFAHLQKYGVFDEIGLEDRSESTFELHVVGPRAGELLQIAGAALPEPNVFANLPTSLADCPILLWRDDPTGRPGFTIMGARGARLKIIDLLQHHGESMGLQELDHEAFEILRIEAGTPVFGRELTEKNLPQEAGRDDRAINFVKGCYLGQETVARIDALGHVNQVIKGLRFMTDTPVPMAGAELQAQGKRAGYVTSTAFSPGWNTTIALAMVRTNFTAPGTELDLKMPDETLAQAVAIVSELPMRPSSCS